MIRNAVFDVDGVFTDGKFHYDQSKKIYKVFGAHDGDAIKFLRYNNVMVYAISADQRGYEITKARMNDMNIPLTYVSEKNRLEYIKKNYPLNSLFFMGDGLFDAQVLKVASASACPANGTSIAKKHAKFVTERAGGNGAVLEAVEWLSTTGFLENKLEDYINVKS